MTKDQLMKKIDRLRKITEEDIKVNEKGEVEISKELQDAVSGGVSPEEQEGEDTNIACDSGCFLLK